MSTGTRYGQDYYLTPRTPRSRVSQSFNRQHDERNEVDYQQAEPLLRSSASDTFEGSGQQIQVRPISLELPPSPRKRGKKGSTQLLTTLTPWLSKAPLILGLIGALLLLGLFILSLQQPETLQKYILENPPTQNVEKVDGMPDFIDYSNYTDFPLEPSEYEEECWLIQEKMKSHPDYWDGMVVDVPHESPPGADGVCSSSITYMLDGSVGLAFDLALIAQVAALARERKRTFIIDDRWWNRGRWTDHFQDVRVTQPGPEPGCTPPPDEELVACPRLARHWVVTTLTARYHFGDPFDNHYEDPYKSDIRRQKPIYDHAYTSFQQTILPSNKVRDLISAVRQNYATKPYMTVHIRHGDRYPSGQKWKGDYIPTKNYVEAAVDVWNRLRTSRPPRVYASVPNVYVASDSFSAFQDFRSIAAFGAENIWGLHISKLPGTEYIANPHGYIHRAWAHNTRPEERLRWTRGMVVDLAMLSGLWLRPGERAPLATICTATSNICKISAVGLGWQKAFDDKLWVDLDWNGSVYPPWNAFELL